jgi:hypothetical protein
MPSAPAAPIARSSRSPRLLALAAAAVAALAASTASAQQASPAARALPGYTLATPPSAGTDPGGDPGGFTVYPSFAPAPGRVETSPALPDAREPVEAPSSAPAFDLAVATEMPLMIGGQATLELPYRFLLQGEVGVLPGAFVNAVDGALVAAGSYDATTSQIVRGALSSSLIVRLSGGWRPFPAHGFEVMGGYTLASMGAGVSARQVIESAAGITVPAEIPDGELQLHSTVHSVHVSLGWRWVVADHFVIRASLAYLQSVASSSHIDVPAALQGVPAVAARIDQANQTIDATLNDTYTKYVKLPVLGISMGYRF